MLLLLTLSALPLGFLINVARILTIYAYRRLMAPATEPVELHFAMGCFWLIPVLLAWPPRDDRTARIPHSLLAISISVILCLLAPAARGPGGAIVVLSTLIGMTDLRPPTQQQQRLSIRVLLWSVAGLILLLLRVSSCWIGWLLLCPLLLSPEHRPRLLRTAALPATIPLLAASPLTLLPVASIATVVLVLSWRKPGPVILSRTALSGAPELTPPALHPTGDGELASSASAWFLRSGFSAVGFQRAATLIFLPLPLLSNSVSGRLTEPLLPPAGVLSHRAIDSGYSVRLIGQSPGIRTTWFSAANGDRHHTLKVCYSYRGVELQETEFDNLYTANNQWYQEFFFLPDGQLISTYRGYLQATFLPMTSPGAHVICRGDRQLCSAEEFRRSTDQIAGQLSQLLSEANQRGP